MSDGPPRSTSRRPGALGVIEPNPERDRRSSRTRHGAEAIAGVDPISLGVLAPPGQFGADIAVGPTQPLGVHMNCGGGVGGFIASRDEERYAREYPTLQVSLCPTSEEGERGFALTLFEQSSYGSRELGNDWTGNSVYLWAVVNAAYMSLLGPAGLRRTRRADPACAATTPPRGSPRFRASRSAGPASSRSSSSTSTRPARPSPRSTPRLRERGIFGGGDLSRSLSRSSASRALYCVTEVHSQGGHRHAS